MPSTNVAALESRIKANESEPQRTAFQERVAAELKSLPCGMIGLGLSPKHCGKPNAAEARARAKQAREA